MKDPKGHIDEVTEKLLEINKILLKLDPGIRGQAFEVLRPLYFGEKAGPPEGDGDGGPPPSTADRDQFYSKWESDKPADNLMHIAAWLYSQHGNIVISAEDIKKEGREAGVNVPDRPDNTMRMKKAKGKSLFHNTGKGAFKLTASGRAYLKDTYNVAPGKKPREQDKSE